MSNKNDVVMFLLESLTRLLGLLLGVQLLSIPYSLGYNLELDIMLVMAMQSLYLCITVLFIGY